MSSGSSYFSSSCLIFPPSLSPVSSLGQEVFQNRVYFILMHYGSCIGNCNDNHVWDYGKIPTTQEGHEVCPIALRTTVLGRLWHAVHDTRVENRVMKKMCAVAIRIHSCQCGLLYFNEMKCIHPLLNRLCWFNLCFMIKILNFISCKFFK